MANVIDILVRANTTQATSGLQKFAGGLNNVVQGLTGLSLAQFTTTGAIIAAGNAVKNAILDYTAYVDAVRKFATTTGMAAEESSRLIQVADDLRISSETMATAMKMMTQNGINPSIAAMAQLSDQYLAAESATARAEIAQGVFGRQWTELAPLLELGSAAILAQAAAIEDNLVVTQEAIGVNNEYLASIDNWEDTIAGVKNEMASGLLPALTDVMQALMEGNKRIEESGAGWMQQVPILQQVIVVWTALQMAIENVVSWISAYNSAAASVTTPNYSQYSSQYGAQYGAYQPPAAPAPPSGGGGGTGNRPPVGPSSSMPGANSVSINVNNNVDAAKIAAQIALAIQRSK